MSSAGSPPSVDQHDSHLRVIADTLPAYVAYVDNELRYVMVNRMYEEWFGRRSEEIVGLPVAKTLGVSYENVRHHLEAALAGEPQMFEAKVRTIEGDRFLLIRHIPDRTEDGAVRGVIIHGIDITDRRNAEQALRDSEERLRLALSAADGIGTWDWDIPANRVKADPTFARFYGVEVARAAAGVPIEEFTRNMHPDDVERVTAAISTAVATGGDYSAEYRLIQDDGSVCWLAARGRCTLADDGAPVRFPGVVIDITARKHSEEALVRTEKLAAVGRLASSIAHEINNPLESVVNLLYLIEATTIEDGEQARRYAQLAQQEIARVSQIATQTLRFFKQATRPSVALLGDLIASVLALYQGRLINSGIRVVQRNAEDASILCYEGEIRQVLNNLVGNAIDAMRNGGELTIRTRRAHHPKTWARGVRVTIADTGEGMSGYTLGRIFEAFFTTKGISGTGLGLWVSSGIIQKHEGRLNVRSSQDAVHHGTTFSLFLPALEQHPDSQVPSTMEA